MAQKITRNKTRATDLIKGQSERSGVTRGLLILKNGTDSFKELFTLYAIIIGVSSVLFAIFEHANVFIGFWWSVMTALTVGYGDVYPHTAAGKVLGIILVHLVTLLIIPLIIGRAVTQLIESPNDFTDEEQEYVKDSLARLNAFLDDRESQKAAPNIVNGGKVTLTKNGEPPMKGKKKGMKKSKFAKKMM